MGISFNSESRQFHLQAKDTSYVMGIERDGFLLHLYWGKKIKAYRSSNFLQLLDRGFQAILIKRTGRSH